MVFPPDSRNAPCTTVAPHAAIAGNSPTATAGACSAGDAWNACAVITMPIHSTIGTPASSGTIFPMTVTVPVRQIAVMTRPFKVE